MKKTFVIALVVCGVGIIAFASSVRAAGPPNVLLFFADQHQAACLGVEGHPDVITPN